MAAVTALVLLDLFQLMVVESHTLFHSLLMMNTR